MAASTQGIIVDTEPKLISLLEKLTVVRPQNRPDDPPNLYFDIEGQTLARDTAYLIDVHTLQGAAFTTANEKGTTIKGILESSTVPKAFFDVRNDSDALFSLFGVKVACVHDIQLMELARRESSKRYVCGLAKCIERDLTAASDRAMAERATNVKRSGERIWNPRLGGSYASFNQRPMPQALIDYCSADVAILPCLWKAYIRGIGGEGNYFWRSQVWHQTMERIKESHKASYNPEGSCKTLGPSCWQPGAVDDLLDSWQDDVFDMIRLGDVFIEPAFGQRRYV